MYPGRDLNPYDRNDHRILSPACLPIPPPGQVVINKKFLNSRRGILSGRRDSNPRPRPWQGRALPAELLSLIILKTLSNPFLYFKEPHYPDTPQAHRALKAELVLLQSITKENSRLLF